MWVYGISGPDGIKDFAYLALLLLDLGPAAAGRQCPRHQQPSAERVQVEPEIEVGKPEHCARRETGEGDGGGRERARDRA